MSEPRLQQSPWGGSQAHHSGVSSLPLLLARLALASRARPISGLTGAVPPGEPAVGQPAPLSCAGNGRGFETDDAAGDPSGQSGTCLESKRVYSAPRPKPSTLWVGPPELAILLIFRPRGLGAARRATARAGRRSWGPVFPPESDLFSEIASAGHSARLRAGPCAPARVRNGVEAVPPLGGTGGFGRIRPPRHAFGGPGSTRPVSRSSSEPPDCLRCRDPKRRLRSCAGYQIRPSRKIPKKVSVWRRCRKALAISPGEVPAWLVWVSPMRCAGRLPEPHEAGTTAR